jgi:hypothetical protein
MPFQRSAAQRNLFADGAVDAVVDFLASEGPGEQTILPAHLSVVCSALSIERAHRGGVPITREFLSVRPGRLMHDFITAAVSDLPPAARALLEEHLTDLRGNSQRVPLADALSRTGLPQEALETLVQRHLVRIDNLSSVPYLSLAHDLLASVLAITRLERLAQAREQSAVLQQAQAQAQIQAQAATVEDKVRRQRTVTWAVGAVAVVVTAVAIAAAVSMSRNRDDAGTAQAGMPTAPSHSSTPAAPDSSPSPGIPSGTKNPAHPPPPPNVTTGETGATGAPAKATPAPGPPEPSIGDPKPEKNNPAPNTPQSPEPPPSAPHPVSPTQPPPPAAQPHSTSKPPDEFTSTSPVPPPYVEGTDVDLAGRSQRDFDRQQKEKYLQERRQRSAERDNEDRATPKRPPAPPRVVQPSRPVEARPAAPVPPPTAKTTPRPSFNRF